MEYTDINKVIGTRYNVFAKIVKGKEEIELEAKLAKQCENKSDEITSEDIDVAGKDIDSLTDYLEMLLVKYNDSKKHLIGSSLLFVLALVVCNWMVALVFLAPIALFLIRMRNIKQDYTFRKGTLGFIKFFHDEIGKSIYNKNYEMNLPFDLNENK